MQIFHLEILKNYKDIYNNNNSEQNLNCSLNKDITDINGEFFTNKDDTFGKLLRDEEQASGRVTCTIYDRFIRIHGGYLIFIIIIILAKCVVVASHLQNYL